MTFGQLVIGPPGSGKTTFCQGMCGFLNGIGRETVVVNLDPANDRLPYPCEINITDLVSVEKAVEQFGLGPNGGMIYCMEFLEKNIDWLIEKIAQKEDEAIQRQKQESEEAPNDFQSFPKGLYWIFDCPGQIELYTHHRSVANIIDILTKTRGMSLVVIKLVDSCFCSEIPSFISSVLNSLAVIHNLALPHINVLSKIDLIETLGHLKFPLKTFTDLSDLTVLSTALDNDRYTSKFKKLNAAVIDMIESYGLVGFHPLNIQDKETLVQLLKAIDKTNGYVFGSFGPGTPASIASLFTVANSDTLTDYERIGWIEERYISPKQRYSNKDEDDE